MSRRAPARAHAARVEALRSLVEGGMVRDCFYASPLAQCTCCGTVYTRDEWQALASRRPWDEMGLEIAECGCGSTISVALVVEP